MWCIIEEPVAVIVFQLVLLDQILIQSQKRELLHRTFPIIDHTHIFCLRSVFKTILPPLVENKHTNVGQVRRDQWSGSG